MVVPIYKGMQENNTSSIEKTSRISLEDLRKEFERVGYLKVPKSIYSLNSSKVRILREEFDNLFDGQYETGIYPDEIHWRSGISKNNVTRELCNAWKSSTIIRNVVTDVDLGSLACSLMGWDCSRLGQDDIIYKPPDSTNSVVGFHQDGPYISDNFVPHENNCLTMWIALDDTDEENGALQYVPGSHRWKYQQRDSNNNDDDASSSSNNNEENGGNTSSTTIISEDVSNSSFHVKPNEDYLMSLRRTIAAGVVSSNNDDDNLNEQQQQPNIVTVAVKAGELLVHHQNIWHGSGPNISKTRIRRALVGHILNGKVRWRTEPSKPHYIYGRYYIRGESIPREDFFPITYSDINNTTKDNNKNDDNDKSVDCYYQRTAWLDSE